MKDIAFAHSMSQVLLGSVDACGELLIHKITENENSIMYPLCFIWTILFYIYTPFFFYESYAGL